MEYDKPSRHHLQWPGKDYLEEHERWLRQQLTTDTTWGPHRRLHLEIWEPPKLDIASTLCVIDYLEEKQPTRAETPLYAIDRLQRLNQDARLVADHFIQQLVFLGVLDET